MRCSAAACLVLLVVAACKGASDGGSSDAANADTPSEADAPPSRSVMLTLDTTTIDSELQATNQVGVTVTPLGGFSGTVALSATGLPGSVTGAFTPAAVDLSSGPAAAALAIMVPSTATPTSVPTTVTVTGDDGASVTASATFTLTVQRAITVTIVPDASTAALAFGPGPIVIHAGTIGAGNTIQVRFYNQDSVIHEVHAAQPSEGFAHDPAPIPPASYDSLIRQVNSPGTYPFTLHDDGHTASAGNEIQIYVP
jgi:plastocyanin